MDDERQRRSSQIVPNDSTIKDSEAISLDEIMVSSNLLQYIDRVNDIGIRSVNDLLKASEQQLSQISEVMTYYDKKEFLKLCSEIKECSTPEDLKLKKFLNSINQPEYYSLFSAKNITLNQLNQLSEDDLMNLGLSELEARFLMIRLKSDVSQQPGGSLVSQNLSYADVTKYSESVSSSSSMNFVASPFVDNARSIHGKNKRIISADEVLRKLGLENRHFAGQTHYEELISNMDRSELNKLTCITIGMAVNSNDGKIESSPPVSEDIEMRDLDEQMSVQQPMTAENAIPSTQVSTVVEAAKRIRPTPRKALNILLLGETGVGKSTFINAFANYVNHETLCEAKNKMLALISSSFFVSDDDYVDHKVEITAQNGQNEHSSKNGESATQSCRSYVFPSKHGAVRIIDTPGVGDTRGKDQDQVNFNNILTYISQYPELTAICILLKPNCSRLTSGFRLCLIQLLNNLEKSASRNIIFVFTNARSTFYQPGDTKPVLEELLREIGEQPPHIKIQFDRSTSYCVDNESFRFLAAITNGLEFLNSSAATIEESWKVTVDECKRLLEYILTLKPHRIRGTVSINEARRLINDLSGPVADIVLEMCLNTTRLDEQKEFLEKNRFSNESISSLKNKLKTKELSVFYENLPQPQTVCVSEKCIGVYENDLRFSQVCHDKCFLKHLQVSERCGDPNLLQCLIFGGLYGHTCRVCECSWEYHMRITRKKIVREVEKEDMGIKVLLQKVTTIKGAIESFDHQLKSYEEEIRILVDTMASFTAFQNLNSITSCGDQFRDILSDNLRIEKYKNERALANNEAVIRKLNAVLRSYDQTKNKLVAGDEANELKAENVFQSEQKLYELPLSGQNLLALKSSIVDRDFDHEAGWGESRPVWERDYPYVGRNSPGARLYHTGVVSPRKNYFISVQSQAQLFSRGAKKVELGFER